MRRLLQAAAVASLLLVPRSTIAADASNAPSVYQFVLFPESQPVIVRAEVWVDGCPLEAAWQDAIAAIFQHADADKDGALSGAELAGAPPPAVLFARQMVGDIELPTLKQLDTGRDGKINLDELAAYYRNNDAGPFQLSTSPVPTTFARPGGATVSAATLNDAIFKTLDGDADGRLSAAELSDASKRLLKLDANGDEALSEQEIAGMPIDPRQRTANDTPPPVAQLIGPDDRRFAGKSSDVSVIIRLGMRAGEARLELIPVDKVNREIKVTERAESLLIEVGRACLELSSAKEAEKPDKMDPDASRLDIDFKGSDLDNNSYLDMNEARQNPAIASLFKLLDANHDGMLFEKEFVDYRIATSELRDKAAAGCAALNISQPGGGLFGLIDANADLLLSTRELRHAGEQILHADSDGDKSLAAAEAPLSYQALVTRGPADLANQITGTFEELTFDAAPPPAGPGPMWFSRMDSNHDGDVSRSEFLGTAEQFKRIDADADGLIDVKEATAADKEFRKDAQ